MSKNVKGVVIDAGHGGSDPGTIHNGITEKDYTLLISKYISERLNDLGIPNALVRSSDETLSPTDRTNRIKNIYGNGSDVITISNHINAGGGDGAEIIYGLRNSDAFSKILSNNFESAGQNVRKYYQRRLPSNPSKDYYFIIRDTANNESVLIEYGFADSIGDDVSQIKNNWQNLAESVVKSIAEYTGYSYIPKSNNSSSYYIVVKGDTLYSIAKKFGLSVDDLKNLNNLNSNLISIGQKLLVTDNLSTNNSQSNLNDNYYIVNKGDTLYSIAKKFNVSVNSLQQANNLNSTLLQINQKLIIPSNNVYIVQKGDTLYSISRKFNTTVSKLESLNNLTTTVLQIGQVLKVN